MPDDDEHAQKLARLEELKRKVEADEDLSEEEERELQEMVADSSMPVQVADD
jgi:hypothetical protein